MGLRGVAIFFFLERGGGEEATEIIAQWVNERKGVWWLVWFVLLHKVKATALKLAEMTAFLKKRQAEDESVQSMIQDTFRQLNK